MKQLMGEADPRNVSPGRERYVQKNSLRRQRRRYSGHSYPVILESLARCGVSYVEPAFIAGYTDPFDESVFSLRQAALMSVACR